jgi:hypothetical protein
VSPGLWNLVGTNYLGKINPTRINRSTHFHIAIDYFGRFILAITYTQPTTLGTISL